MYKWKINFTSLITMYYFLFYFIINFIVLSYNALIFFDIYITFLSFTFNDDSDKLFLVTATPRYYAN